MALGNAHGRDRAPFTQSIFTSHYHHQAQEALVMCTIQTSQVALDANSACETTGFINPIPLYWLVHRYPYVFFHNPPINQVVELTCNNQSTGVFLICPDYLMIIPIKSDLHFSMVTSLVLFWLNHHGCLFSHHFWSLNHQPQPLVERPCARLISVVRAEVATLVHESGAVGAIQRPWHSKCSQHAAASRIHGWSGDMYMLK